MTGAVAKSPWLTLGVWSIALLLGLAGCVAVPGAPGAPAAGSAQYRVSSQPPGDGITIEDATEDVTIDITSEKGIGSTDILRAGSAPKTLTVNFQLKGLEEMTFAWGDTRVTAHVGSGDGAVQEEVSLAGAPATSIDDTSPYWMPVRIEAENPKVPLQSGFFAVTAPPAFLQAAPNRFTLGWIDFYR